MRLGILGGSFDPVHYGHLLLAESCREQCRLDRVWLMPAGTPPHKRANAIAAAEHRVEMLRLAIGGDLAFEVSRLEVDRGGVSYTAETLREIRGQLPAAELFLLLGADMFADLSSWRFPDEICSLAVPVVAARPDWPAPDFELLRPVATAARVEEARRHRVEMPLIQLSASDIRRRVAEGKSIRFRTPRAVEKYIETHGLYRT